MARLTEEMVIARSKQSDLAAIKKLNCWGAELGDVSLLRRMPNVEVLALSINQIRTLADFATCRRLRELYIRKNAIADLREIRHLRRLPQLASLWLDENPCTQHPEYRLTVLRNLPNLEKLDNVPVQPEEVLEAGRRGAHIPDSDDEGYPQSHQDTYAQYRRGGRRDSDSSADETYAPAAAASASASARRQGGGGGGGSDGSEGAAGAGAAETTDIQSPVSPPPPAAAAARRPHSPPPECEERRDQAHSAHMSRSQHEGRRSAGARSPEDALRHSLSAHSVKDYSYSSNGDCRYSAGPGASVTGPGTGASPGEHHYHDQYYERPDRCEYGSASRCAGDACERERECARDGGRERDSAREYASAVMGERRGFTRRPVTRNSNLLSALLCLVKELDYPSLEVAEMAVRCRMDELASGQ